MIALLFVLQPVLPVPGDELHVVCVHEPRIRQNGQMLDVKVQVVVNRPRKDVTLFLSAYNPCTWEVVVGPQTTIKKVILGGYHAQAAVVPKGAEVVELYYEARQKRPNKDYVSAHYNIDSDRFRPAAQAIRKFTGTELASFQGSYNYDPLTPFVVKAVQNDERLRSDFPRLSPASGLPDFRFNATRLRRSEYGFSNALFGEFNHAGPDKKTLKGLPRDILQVAYDPGAKVYYGITGHELHLVDLEKGTSVKIEPPKGIDPNWLRSLTYDTKRERVVISGRNAMYEYVTKGGGKWSVLIPNNKGSFSALAWQASTATLYAIGNDEHAPRQRDGGSWLYELTADGAVVDAKALSGPVFPGLLQGGAYDRAELVDRGAFLAALIYRENRDSGSGQRGDPESFLYLIDPKTGTVKLAWKE